MPKNQFEFLFKFVMLTDEWKLYIEIVNKKRDTATAKANCCKDGNAVFAFF